ncbi:MAG: PH domain-containing protein [Peptostreptococcaceae bacterium]
MATNFFGKVAADTLGLSDIGKIIEPKDFDKVDGDDYIMHEDGEKIYFVIKSKSDEYVFTNRGLLHVDGATAVSKKRTVKRHDFYYEKVHSVTLETAGTIDLDIEIKFSFGDNYFSIDVDKKQIERLKDLYKALVEVSTLQGKNYTAVEDGMNGLKMANDAISRCTLEGNAANIVEELTNFNFNWMKEIRENHNNKDFGAVFEKYINN